MRVEFNHRNWHVDEVKSLTQTLAFRDSRGGAWFFLAHGDGMYPCLSIRVTGEIADVIYYPEEYHPGFRCLGGEGLSEDGDTILVYEGCDPSSGEQTPNRFVVPFETALSIATEFFRNERMSDAVSWLEL